MSECVEEAVARLVDRKVADWYGPYPKEELDAICRAGQGEAAASFIMLAIEGDKDWRRLIILERFLVTVGHHLVSSRIATFLTKRFLDGNGDHSTLTNARSIGASVDADLNSGLMALIDHSDLLVAEDAIDLLSRCGSVEVETFLLRHAERFQSARSSREREIFCAIITALGCIGTERCVPCLKSATLGKTHNAAASAVSGVSRIKGADELTFFVERLEHGSSREIKFAAMQAIAKHGDGRAVGAVLRRVKVLARKPNNTRYLASGLSDEEFLELGFKFLLRFRNGRKEVDEFFEGFPFQGIDRYLLDHLTNAALAGVEPQRLSRFLQRVCEGKTYVVSEIMTQGEDPNACDDEGATALQLAVRFREEKMVLLLLDAGAEPNRKSKDGMTALMWGARIGCIEVVRLLLERGADALLKDGKGRTAADHAKDQQHEDVFQMLAHGGS